MKTITRIEIDEDSQDFFRHSYGPLSMYGKNQEEMYGKKENLITRLENRYKVTLGKHIRVLRDDVILFFPTKIGLTGKLAYCDWDVFDVDFRCASGLESIKPVGATSERSYEKLLSSFSVSDVLRPSLNNDRPPLYVYQYRNFYVAKSVTIDLINFADIT